MKLAYAVFYTNNLKKICDFYDNVLSFERAFGNDTFVAYKIGDALLGVKKAEISREIPGHQTVIIEVPDADKLYLELKHKEVTIFSQISNDYWGRNFSILDLDLNRIEFFTKK